ncbi:MAG: DUF1553 domain-containing protein [Acidobacteria bacterium]|nr:DUF1553 domain-containing protein [Acidobacteriota bacterium]
MTLRTIAARSLLATLLWACPSLAQIDSARARRHWSFQPLSAPAPPEVRQPRWVHTPVDRFVLAQLEAKMLRPAPEADRRTLLRRVTFDLTGLPPTPAEVEAFLKDTSPEAWRRVVTRLLDSPHYGERWGRHWLDLVRYAETDGHEFDVDKPNVHRYRDYVVRAFNDDLPYNRFVLEHLAGDQLDPRPVETVNQPPLATAFYWLGEVINTPVDSVQSMADRVDNQIDVIGKTFLGLTVACARCHDHKFDPIPTADYYSLAGFLHSSRLRQAVVDAPGHEQAIASLAQRLGRRPGPSRPLAHTFPPDFTVYEDFTSPAAGRWKFTGTAFEIRDGVLTSGGITAGLRGAAISKMFEIPQRYIHMRVAGKAEIKLVVDEYQNKTWAFTSGDQYLWRTIDARMVKHRNAYFQVTDLLGDGHIEVDAIVFSDQAKPPAIEASPALFPSLGITPAMPESVFALTATDGEPVNTKIHLRGNHKTLGSEVPRQFLSVLAGSAQQPVTEGSGRLELARRLTDPENPLLARVMVNRIWKHHFGHGLVRTPDNFGLTGDRPTHPALLDWLARRFIDSGWSVKSLHRLILDSAAYRMSSTASPAALAADPDNKLLHRGPIRRLEAEAIRDNLLAVAGVLDRTVYGPPVPVYVSPFMDGDARGKPKPGPLDGANRRSIYINVRRNYLPDSLTVFDFPQPISTIGNRNVSAVPSQSLFLMNNEFVSQQAGRWAARIASLPGGTAIQVNRMYLEAFAREPRPAELAEAKAFLASGATLQDYAHVLMCSTEFHFIR